MFANEHFCCTDIYKKHGKIKYLLYSIRCSFPNKKCFLNKTSLKYFLIKSTLRLSDVYSKKMVLKDIKRFFKFLALTLCAHVCISFILLFGL